MIKLHKIDTKSVDAKLKKHLWNCSYKDAGHLFSDFEYTQSEYVTCKNYIVYATYNNKFAGWGLRFKPSKYDTPAIMLHVYKKYRRKGIGTMIVKSLTNNRKINNYKYYKDSSNKYFFEKLESQE